MRQHFFITVFAISFCAPLFAAEQMKTFPEKNQADSNLPSIKMELTPQERREIAKTLAFRFAPEVQASGQNLQGWAEKFGRFIGKGDAANIQRAMTMPTLNLATAVLMGQPLNSPPIQAALKEIQSDTIGPNSLGMPYTDTAYTPLPNGRCRVADSRMINSPLPGGVTRLIKVENISSYSPQGGNGSSGGNSSQGCGIPDGTTALVISATILSNGQEGFFKIYPEGGNYTQGNTVYYTSTVSAANDVTVKSCQTCEYELQIYSSSSAHYVLDVMGYFIRPGVTALECVSTPVASVSLPSSGSTGKAISPACASNYTRIRTNCETATYNTFLNEAKDGVCSAKNTGATASEVRASSTCCRIPGR